MVNDCSNDAIVHTQLLFLLLLTIAVSSCMTDYIDNKRQQTAIFSPYFRHIFADKWHNHTFRTFRHLSPSCDTIQSQLLLVCVEVSYLCGFNVVTKDMMSEGNGNDKCDLQFVEALRNQLGTSQFVGKITQDNSEAYFCIQLKTAKPTLKLLFNSSLTNSCSSWEFNLLDSCMLKHVSMLLI
jgi:hypothetical protein